uniref:TIR domain-containing protein n=1 Tax=Podarcis muralis TaxID=64176 RepID=A0A670K4N3_PODMU
ARKEKERGVHSFGLTHCILSPNRPGLATCSGQAISNLTSVTLQLPNSTRWLNASNNKVTHLTSTTFSHLPHLLELYLDHNNISGIEYNAFHSLEDLEVLDLSWNQLVSVESSMLSSLRNLRELFLGHNSIATLHPSSLISQVALQELHLPNNNLSSLQEVATATQGLANLTFLDLGSNQISTPCMGSSWIVFPSLRNLSLNSNGISRLDLSNCSFPNLQQLNLTHNNMSQVEAGSFRATPVLVELSFNMNPLDISQLINATLPNLTMLHLSSMNPPLNESMSAACSFFKSLSSLTSLDIQHSQMNDTQLRQLGSCTNLTWLDLSTTGYKYLKNGVFETFQGLEFLSLEKCKVLRLSSSAWGKQMQLRTLILRRNSISQLEDSVFRPLNQLSYLDLSKNHLTNLQQRSFFGMEALRTLILQGCQITAVTRNTFHYARKMEFLDLRDNSIKLIKPRAFLLKHMGTLLLSGNKILTVKRNGFYQLNSLRYLYLDHNLLYKLSRGVFTPLKKLEILDISHNHLFTYNKYDYPSPFAGLRSLRKLDLSFQSPRLPICPPDKVLQGLGNLQYLSLKGNPSLLHGYYLLRGWGFKRLRQKGQEYQYDAYISCCSQDHEWVVNNVLEKLEVQGEPSLRLCFGPRDFAPGEYYIDNVQNGISQSRKTLCVVSDNYLESEWCSLEIQLACSKIYYQREDPLVVVFMEEIPNYSQQQNNIPQYIAGS